MIKKAVTVSLNLGWFGQEALRPEVIGWLHVFCSLRTVLSRLENSRVVEAGQSRKPEQTFPHDLQNSPSSAFPILSEGEVGSFLVFFSPCLAEQQYWNHSATRTGQHLKVTSLAGAVWVEVIADVQANIQRVSRARAWAMGPSTFSGVEGEYESREDWRTGRSRGALEEKQQSRPVSRCPL